MKLIKWFFIVVLVALLALLAFLAYLGIFSPLKVTEQEMGPFTFVYESYVGQYKDTGKVFHKVYQAMLAEGITTVRGIGIYYDDPAITPKDKLHSDCGVIIETKDYAKLADLKKKNFKIMSLPKEMSVVAEFPLKNPVSLMIGPMKGYPALVKYFQRKGYKWTTPFELYDMPGGKIFYVMHLKTNPKLSK